jgi:hypothetical protein
MNGGPERPTEKRVELGRVFATPGVLAAVPNDEMLAALARHARGDWGEVSAPDWKENDFSYSKRLRLVSSYTSSSGTKYWVITEADRSSTTVLLPDEY